MTLANKLTLARLFVALLAPACLWAQRPALYGVAFALYVLAVSTDWIDGLIARRTGSISPFGAMADPIADKVLVLGALTAFVRIPETDVPVWAVFLIVVRELIIGGLRALAGLQGKVLAADRGGKWAMGVQSGAVLVILAFLTALHQGWLPPASGKSLPAALTLLCLAASWLSGGLYLYRSRRLLQQSWEAPRA